MDGFWRLVLLSLSMFFGCYVSGMIPLVLSLSAGVLRKVTTFGAGLLIGTALIVIIPEGMEALFGEALHSHHNHHSHTHESDLSDLSLKVRSADEGPINNLIPNSAHVRKIKALSEEGALPGSEEGLYSTDQLQFMMGFSLILGFVFMLLIDQCSGGHAHSIPDAENGANGNARHSRHKMTATIGLVVHAAADGLALGAAAGLSKADVELVIFLAIMLHKAPAAFGFTSFLIHEGHDKYTAKKHLLMFSLAAPIASFVSFFGLVKVMYLVHLPLTGIAMLFSAGTFLYVSTVHVLNEVVNSSAGGEANSNGGKLSKTELVWLVSGAFLPLLFNAFHSHGH
ncbi:zinc transporter ZIP9-like isoform X2 [Halichondria panicea]|uniref:zinc transporter ZIP9-like isoform X2 n=1 Tax=Halichondria panicea TaxID=6063 RepID=UPI00312B60E3